MIFVKIYKRKRYIKSSSNVNTLEFEIDLIYSFNDGITAAFNPNLTDSELDDVIEETAEEHYYAFMNSVAINLKAIGFETLEGPNFSNRNNSKSCYFVLCKEDEYEALNVKIILNLRISDHRLTKHKGNNKNWDRFDARNEYYARELENYRDLNEKNPDDLQYDRLEIIVSGHKFQTYRQALSYIVNRVKSAFRS